MKAFNPGTCSTTDLERLVKCARNPEERRAIAEELADRRRLYQNADQGTPSLFAPRPIENRSEPDRHTTIGNV